MDDRHRNRRTVPHGRPGCERRHQSRHTAATTVFLSNGVPIETVSSMLGHKSIKTTQIYAKITKEKLNQDMENLAARLNGIEEFSCCTI